MKKNKISASILAADFSKLGDEIRRVTEAGADSLHLDIMDGCFVPNISFGSDIVKTIRKESQLDLKTHLMINEPEKYIDDFVNAGSDMIIFHYEATRHHDRLIDYIKDLGVKVGISIIPSTPESVLQYVYHKLDEILIMTVNPGFGGQKFLKSQLEKIKRVAEMTKHLSNIDIAVDGGINPETMKECKKMGANVAIAGSYIFQGEDYRRNIALLRTLLNK
jgi:ribulose-phosphate 3-epimerase